MLYTLPPKQKDTTSKTPNISVYKFKEIPAGSPFFCVLMKGQDGLYSGG